MKNSGNNGKMPSEKGQQLYVLKIVNLKKTGYNYLIESIFFC